MKILEVNGGYCRKPFECDFVPVPTYSSLFIDITNVSPQPDEFWSYDYNTKLFKAPEADVLTDHMSEYTIKVRWQDIRNKREIYLAESDWTQLLDCKLSWKEKRAWKKYRQELRDIPQKYAGQNPLYIVFPPRPTYMIQRNLVDRIKTFIKLLFKGKA
jgi:hypothetical protein